MLNKLFLIFYNLTLFMPKNAKGASITPTRLDAPNDSA